MRERNEVIGFLRCFLFSNGLTNLYFLLRTERMLKVKIWLMSPAIIASRESFQNGKRIFVWCTLSFSSTPFTGTKRKKERCNFYVGTCSTRCERTFFQSTHIRINMCGNQWSALLWERSVSVWSSWSQYRIVEIG